MEGIKPLSVASDRTDVFREQVDYAENIRRDLAAARKIGKAAINEVRRSLGAIDAVEAGVAVDILLSYRSVKDWRGMIDLVGEMPEPLRRTVMVQEQLGLALNRAGRGDEAEQVLKKLLKERGPSSETLGILGRVYKDCWEAAGERASAKALLKKAVDTYRRGFETDWRDHYPGINAVTLMELQEPPNEERVRLIPVVRYSVERRIESGDPDYWDWATLLELEVLGRDEEGADRALGQALAEVREAFEPETTRRNLRLIREVRERRGEHAKWAEAIEIELEKAENARLANDEENSH